MPSNFGDTLLLCGRDVTLSPAAGMLCEYKGEWAMLDDNAWQYDLVAVAEQEPRRVICAGSDDIRRCCTPLLPAPSQLDPANLRREAFAAVATLPGVPYFETGPYKPGDLGNLHIPLETGTLILYWGDWTLEYRGNRGTPTNYEARGRDYRREGALRAWLAAVGQR